MSIFDTIVVKKPKRSTFDLSHDVKLTTDFGKLVPFMCEEVVPGDTWYNKSDVLVRFTPLIAPVMHRMWVTTHFFYVPFRLLWDNYETFETGGKDGMQTAAFPKIALLGKGTSDGRFKDTDGLWKHGSLADYLNYPTSEENFSGSGLSVSSLPLRAYQMIYNEYYRDENLEEEVVFSLGDGLVSTTSAEYKTLLTLRNRAWRKDYFTSALPWPQKGPSQAVPLIGNLSYDNSVKTPSVVRSSDGTKSSDIFVDGSGFIKGQDSKSYSSAIIDNHSQLSFKEAGININDLRRSSRIQQLYEAQARGGSRLKEWLLSIFGVNNDDLRLSRPQFLGGGNTPVQVTDILQTSQTTESSPMGQYAGLGFSFGSSNSFKNTFKERGYIIGIVSVMPECGYTEGLPRAYYKFDKLDFALPQLADIGEQEIYNYELSLRSNAAGNSSAVTDAFGYAPRYSEYKFIPNRVHGELKDMNSYGYWTLNRHFSNAPTLSQQFITVDADADDLNRIFAVKDSKYPKLLCQISNSTKARRCMPYNPIPTL